jgi:hypothetical protein
MTIQTLNNPVSCTTTPIFRTWASALSTAIAAQGWVLTTDTGQINWASVNAPLANAAAGYEIWRAGDALQATAPLYIKIEYGCGPTTASGAVWITCGTGTDGAGTITGTTIVGVSSTAQMTTRSQHWSSGAGGSLIYVNGDASTLAIFACPAFTSTSSSGYLTLVERTRAFDGTPSADGYIVLNSGGSGGYNNISVCSYLPNSFGPNQGQQLSGWAVAAAGPSATNVVAGVLYPQPVFTGYNVRLGGPSQFVMAMVPTDLAGGVTVSFPHYGVSRSWLSAGYGSSNSGLCWGAWGGPNRSFLFRTS